MDTAVVNGVLRDAVIVAIKLSAPPLLLGLIVGVFMALFQAVTQIHEQSLNFVLKAIVIVLILLLAGNWMLTSMQDYFREILTIVAS